LHEKGEKNKLALRRRKRLPVVGDAGRGSKISIEPIQLFQSDRGKRDKNKPEEELIQRSNHPSGEIGGISSVRRRGKPQQKNYKGEMGGDWKKGPEDAISLSGPRKIRLTKNKPY